MNIYNANILNERINISIFTFEKKKFKNIYFKNKIRYLFNFRRKKKRNVYF